MDAGGPFDDAVAAALEDVPAEESPRLNWAVRLAPLLVVLGAVLGIGAFLGAQSSVGATGSVACNSCVASGHAPGEAGASPPVSTSTATTSTPDGTESSRLPRVAAPSAQNSASPGDVPSAGAGLSLNTPEVAGVVAAAVGLLGAGVLLLRRGRRARPESGDGLP